MSIEELKQRTKKFALDIIRLSKQIPKNDEGIIIKKQLLRAATSVGSNYRATCRARSTAEFISKIGVVIEEADESAFWLELLIEGNIMDQEKVIQNLQEADEIIAIMVSSRQTAIKNKN